MNYPCKPVATNKVNTRKMNLITEIVVVALSIARRGRALRALAFVGFYWRGVGGIGARDFVIAMMGEGFVGTRWHGIVVLVVVLWLLLMKVVMMVVVVLMIGVVVVVPQRVHLLLALGEQTTALLGPRQVQHQVSRHHVGFESTTIVSSTPNLE